MIKRVVSTLCISCLLATRFLYVAVAEEQEDPPTEYIKIDIPNYSYAAYQYWFLNGYNKFYIPLDANGDPLLNSSGISASENININSNQANSTYTENESYNLSGSISENIKGSLYAQAQSGTGGTINYNITTGSGSAVGNLPITGTESITGNTSGSGTIINGKITSLGNSSISGLSENQITYVYDLPWLKGSYVHPNSYSSNNNIMIYRNYKYYLVFYSSKNLYQNGIIQNLLNYYVRSGYEANINVEKSGFNGNGIYYYVVTFSANNYTNSTESTYITIDFPAIDGDTKIIPMYYGNGSDLTDDQKSMFSIVTNLENTIISGTSGSQYTESNVSNSNSTLRNRVNSLENYESTFNSNLNSSLNLITLPDVNGVVKFGNAARWVSTQYTRIANDQRINFPLIFCLTLGLALTILGRIRT